MMTHAAIDARKPRYAPRDPEQKTPTIPPITTIQPRVLSDGDFLCNAKKRPIGTTIISNSPKESGTTNDEDARYKPFRNCGVINASSAGLFSMSVSSMFLGNTSMKNLC